MLLLRIGLRVSKCYDCVFFFFFFFKQKTAYEMLRSLVGSEMCIRDRCSTESCTSAGIIRKRISPGFKYGCLWRANCDAHAYTYSCLLYTSDAADDLLCVDLGGRRIIKKKKNKQNQYLLRV